MKSPIQYHKTNKLLGLFFSKTNQQISINKDRDQFIIPITALENFTITINKKNTILELTDDEIAAEKIRMNAQGEKAAIANQNYTDTEAAKRKEKQEKQTQEKAEKDAAELAKYAAERDLLGPWQTSKGKVNLVEGDRIIIILNKEIEIKMSYKKVHPGQSSESTIKMPPNFPIIGTVDSILDNNNMVIQPDNDQYITYVFPLSAKPNLEILTTGAKGDELTEELFLKLYNPDIYDQDFICQLIKKNPNIYNKLHDANRLPKKIDKEGKKYKCNNGVAYKADILSRVFGPSSSGGKKSRKINKKKIPTTRKTTRKTRRKTTRKTRRKTRRKTIKKIYKKK